MNSNLATSIRLVALVGIALSLVLAFYAPQTSSGRVLASLSRCAAIVFAVVYFFAVMAVAESGWSGLFPWHQ